MTFYSVRRDTNADPVSIGSENSLGLIYVGESNGKKYYVSRNECCDNNTNNGYESYSTAATAAKNFGGYLAVFETQAEQENVHDLLDAASLSGNYWIGYKYNYETSNWEWINDWTGGGSTMYTDSSGFDTSTTGGALNNPYAFYNSNYGPDGEWFNGNADQNYRYLLEFDNNVAAGSDVDLVLSTGGTATEGSSDDYSLSASTLTISSGQSSASITLSEGAANTTDEPTETIIITAALASGESDARIKSSQKTLTLNLIDDDDTAVTWSSGGTITEGTDSTISLTATLNNVKPFDTAITLDISGTATVEDDYASDDDGFITTVKALAQPWGVVQDSDGNTYVSSRNSRVIYKIDSSGNQTTYAGTGGWENNYVTDAQPVSLAKFRDIKSMTIDTSGRMIFFI